MTGGRRLAGGGRQWNRTQVDAARLYELGRVFQRVSADKHGDVPAQPYRLGLVLWEKRSGDWTTDQREALARLKDTLADGTVVGQVGAVHPAACEALELGGFAAAAEIELDLLQGAARDAYGYEPVPKFPASPVDLSVIVPVGVLHADVASTLRASAPEHVRSIEFVADFRGAPIPDGQKSLTYRLLFQSPERTMAMTEVQAEVNACVEVLAARFGAWVRA